MRIVFRTEGNHTQGMGDVWGSIALGDECREAGAEILFVTSGGSEAAQAITGRGYRLRAVDSLTEEEAVLREFHPDVILVNKLDSPPEELRILREAGGLLVTLDDTSEGAACADVRVNVLYHVPGAVTDPEYVTLRKEFQKLHGLTKAICAEVGELLVTQGGADTYGFTPRIVRAMEGLSTCPHCTVVVGPAFRHDRELEEARRGSGLNLTIVRSAPNMSELMWRADLAITAGGLGMFELACVGTPSIVICGEPFEVETATRLEQAGVVRHLGFGGTLDYTRVAPAVDALAADTDARQRMSARGKSLIDGRGCERIVRLIRDLTSRSDGRLT